MFACPRSHSSHAAARASPPNVNGPPGQACVLNTEIPKLETASNTAGTQELPLRLSDTAAATAPTDMTPNLIF